MINEDSRHCMKQAVRQARSREGRARGEGAMAATLVSGESYSRRLINGAARSTNDQLVDANYL